MKELERALIESENTNERTKSSQLDSDSELFELRKKMMLYEKEIKQLKLENNDFLTKSNNISDQEVNEWKTLELQLRHQLEQSSIDYEDVLRQLTVERTARQAAEVCV